MKQPLLDSFFPEFPSLLQPPLPCLMGRCYMGRKFYSWKFPQKLWNSSPVEKNPNKPNNIHGSSKITSNTDISDTLQEACGESFFVNVIWIYVGNNSRQIQVLANEDFLLLCMLYSVEIQNYTQEHEKKSSHTDKSWGDVFKCICFAKNSIQIMLTMVLLFYLNNQPNASEDLKNSVAIMVLHFNVSFKIKGKITSICLTETSNCFISIILESKL